MPEADATGTPGPAGAEEAAEPAGAEGIDPATDALGVGAERTPGADIEAGAEGTAGAAGTLEADATGVAGSAGAARTSSNWVGPPMRPGAGADGAGGTERPP